jgi:Protein of unknown function (DUF1460)
MKRRHFLWTVLASYFSADLLSALAVEKTSFKGDAVLKRIISHAQAGHWAALPVGELMGKITREFEGTPYVANTLEFSPDRETCSANLLGLDCVTFFETTLDLARTIKKGLHKSSDLLAEIAYTRYRGGVPGDYSTRLHYTTDWFIDNEKKGVVKLLTDLPGATKFGQKVGFMSAHPASYPPLVSHPELVAKIKSAEEVINSHSFMFYPTDRITALEGSLRTGDIVGLCTAQAGLDIAHTGLVYRTEDGVAHFMDASSRKNKMKVVLEPTTIGEYMTGSKSIIGAMFARPLELQ